ncbi:ornithine cyclodeaminase family protein [Streptomyces solicathayae]|uniref:Ornithine cyclodeaminase family protein n=1 Tax=Streptomyces solicathayae TaxID=3081768 RepID=A0ABZ0M3R2_9ACTN|nr:ornithine cyclodeaminase family protein [Streptomyces sp. HUAS YS2]WOX26422.1 ornithine cyclodeaminase family protein [Streptomyces sp. HUAS YS2]
MTLILTRSEIHRLLDPATAEVEAVVEQAHRDVARGRAVLPAPPAMGVPGSDGVFLPMAAVSAPTGLATVKLLADLPGNRERGLPAQRSAVLALSAENGDVAALLDGALITRYRTAAATAVATRALAAEDARVLGLIGTGPLALAHVRALLTVRKWESVVVWGRTPENGAALVAQVTREFGLRAELLSGPRQVTEAADVLCTLTPSREPVVEGAWLRPGQHVNAVGAPPRPDHREIDTEGVVRSRLVVDSVATARLKSGEVLIPLAEGALTEADFDRELGHVLEGLAPGRTSPSDITMFNSVGVGLQDLALARLLIDLATESGTGTRIDLGA